MSTSAKSLDYNFGKKLTKAGAKKPTPKPKSALQKTRELLKLKQDSLDIAYQANKELAEERDYWMFKKSPKGFLKKLMYIIKH